MSPKEMYDKTPLNASATSPTTTTTTATTTGLTAEVYGFEDASDDCEQQNQQQEEGSILSHAGTIGMLGSISIAVNSLAGPAMLNLPSVFQKSGLLPTIFTIAFLCLLSTLCSLHMADAISRVPNNQKFTKQIEYSEAYRIYWGNKSFIATQFAFYACILFLNVASIIDTAQVVDQILSKLDCGTIALSWSGDKGWEVLRWYADDCTAEADNTGHCIPFQPINGSDEDDIPWLLTIGYILSCFLFLPLSLQDLKENAFFQIVGFIALIVLSCQFVGAFLLNGVDFGNVTLWGTDWSDLFGVVLFNFAVVIAVPAWLYEKKSSVNVRVALNNSSWIGFILYILVGGLGALTMPDVTDNMLQSMMSGEFGPVTEISSMIFALFIIGLGIPLFSVLTRLNLTGCDLLSNEQANLLAVYLPWIIACLLYSGGKTSSMLGWGGIVFTSIIVFLAPLTLAIQAIEKSNSSGSVHVYGTRRSSGRDGGSSRGRFLREKSTQKIALYGLLSISFISILLAISGEIVS